MHIEFWLGGLHLISCLGDVLSWEGDIKMDVGEMCCAEEVFQTATVVHLNLNNILKLDESNLLPYPPVRIVKFHNI
jgi:hypothetical protein